jgi:hypothetical protein
VVEPGRVSSACRIRERFSSSSSSLCWGDLSPVFYAVIEPGDKRGVVVSFPDVPEAISQADDVLRERWLRRRSAWHC